MGCAERGTLVRGEADRDWDRPTYRCPRFGRVCDEERERRCADRERERPGEPGGGARNG